jgi:hypothetical protein
LIKLNRDDNYILSAALRENSGFHLAAKWYLGFDPLGFQYAWHMCPIKNTTFLAGVGAGKTTITAASNTIDCLSLPGFRALNASITSKQAELAFEMFSTWRENNKRLDRLVTDVVLRPYPSVKFYNGSVYEFRTAGLGAKFIRGSEYDRINYDEGGLDNDGEAIRVLRGRLRGIRPDGRARMARLDVTGTPSASVWFRERFEKGLKGGDHATPESLRDYFSMRIRTYDNIRLTKEQIRLMEAEYPPELIDIELNAMFPDYGMSMFPHNSIQACTDASLNDDMEEAIHPETGNPTPGYILEEWPRVGVVHYEVPPKPLGIYVMAGDPGVDTPPKRNSPCVIVADVSKKPYEIVYFHWVSGRGSYAPFLGSFKYAMTLYAPVSKGIDVTGPQKALDELGFENFGLVLDSLSFGGLKDTLLNSLLMAITNQAIRMPRILGMLNQLNNYRREDDKPTAHVEQDIVMTLAMVAYLARFVNQPVHNSNKPNYIRSRGRGRRTVVPVGARIRN